MTRTEQNFFSLFQEWSEEDDLWDLLKKSDLPIYIYGMGNGADRLAERLHSLGIAEKGYFASNAFVRGQSFRGFPVETFSAILERESRVIALLAFGTLFGFVGLLLAVPVAASIGVVVRFGVERYLQSRLYTSEEPVLLAEPEE
jgi:hypothetical protein